MKNPESNYEEKQIDNCCYSELRIFNLAGNVYRRNLYAGCKILVYDLGIICSGLV